MKASAIAQCLCGILQEEDFTETLKIEGESLIQNVDASGVMSSAVGKSFRMIVIGPQKGVNL